MGGVAVASTPRTRATRACPRALRAALTACVVVVTVAAATALAAVLPHVHDRAASGPPITLADDANGAALFALNNLVPGDTAVRCLRLSYQGSTPGDVRLSAAGGGTLAPFLHMTVEVGSRGAVGDCSLFSGTPVYTGTLDDLVAHHASYAGGVELWSSLAAGTGVMRVTAHVDDGAPQSLAASLNMTIEARTDGPMTVGTVPDNTPKGGGGDATPKSPVGGTGNSSPPVTTTVPGPAPFPNSGAQSTPLSVHHHSHHHATPSVSGITSAPGSSAGSVTGQGSGTTGAGTSIGLGDEHGHRHAGGASALKQAADTVLHDSVATLERSPLPLLLLILMGLFLLVQNRIDSRDPKLALAAAHADPTIPFSDPPEDPVLPEASAVP
jgi:hypothetical protein